MIVYLSGPMTGYDDLNFPAFHEAAAVLRAAGYAVLSPAETAGGVKTLPMEWYLRHDIGMLLDVEAIVMLPGWSRSRGALVELTVAHALGLPVYEYIGNVAYRKYLREVTVTGLRAPFHEVNVAVKDRRYL